MKNLSDLLQIVLTYPGGFGFLLRLLGVAALLLVASTGGKVVAALWALRPRIGFGFFFGGALILLFVQVAGRQVADLMQLLLEPPVYAEQYEALSEDAKEAAFERVLQQQVSPAEFAVVRDMTRATAQKLGVQPSDVYAVAAAECGLNPFARNIKNGRTVAAGWIQFTATGCQHVAGLQHDQVLQACDRRDVAAMLAWSEQYLLATSAGRPLRGALDVYLCVFAPALVGAPDSRVLYEGYSNPAYYQNVGMDGWVRRADGRIVRLIGQCDGKITVGELNLRLLYFTAKITKE